MDQSQIQKVTMKTMLPKDAKDSWKLDPWDLGRLATIIVPPIIMIKGDKDLVANASTKIEHVGNTTREGGPINACNKEPLPHELLARFSFSHMLKLPKVVIPMTWKRGLEKVIFNYNKSILMKSIEYVSMMQQKTKWTEITLQETK